MLLIMLLVPFLIEDESEFLSIDTYRIHFQFWLSHVDNQMILNSIQIVIIEYGEILNCSVFV